MRSAKDPAGAIVHDTPVPAQPGNEFWGSDPIAAVLGGLDIPYIALVPGSSYRGLHDSIVNYLGNRAPQMVLTLHEENTVAIAHGYAKASGRMMAAAMHANIGIMRAVMAVYNAWCDRAPILMFGATGPWDATRRRPWIDWIHTSADQGAIVRNITKWDNQPGSVGAAVEAIMRAAQIAQTAPQGPVYVNLEVAMQEEKIGALPPLPDVARYAAPPAVRPAPELVAAAARLLSGAKSPLMLAGRCSRSLEGWNARVALAEKLNMPVLTHIKLAAAFPTDHRLHAAPPGPSLTPEALRLAAGADVILALDWLDLAGTLKQAYGAGPVAAKVINVSCDAHSHRGWSMDHQGLPPADVYLMCETDAAVPLLLEAVSPRTAGVKSYPSAPLPPAPTEAVSMRGVGIALEAATRGIDVCYTRFPLGWNGAYTHLRHPLDYIGHDGGAGVGSGPGHDGRRGACVEGLRAVADRHHGRRGFPDGEYRGMDRRALPDPLPDDREQQPLVLQRRAPPRTHGARARAAGGEPLDRPAHRRARHRHRRHGAHDGRDRHRAGYRSGQSAGRHRGRHRGGTHGQGVRHRRSRASRLRQPRLRLR